jgi:hypothetical protein
MQHHYFGEIAGFVDTYDDVQFSFVESKLAAMAGRETKKHIVRDLRSMLYNCCDAARKPYDLDTFLRWYPMVKLEIHLPRKADIISVMCFLIYCYDDDTFGFFLNKGAFDHVINCVKKGEAITFGTGAFSTINHTSGLRLLTIASPPTARQAYLPDICLKCSMRVSKGNLKSRSPDLAGAPLTWCNHEREDEYGVDADSKMSSMLDLWSAPHVANIFSVAQNPWTTITVRKGTLVGSSKLKLYFGIVELGSKLGPGVVGITTIEAYNRQFPGAPQENFAETEIKDKDFAITNPAHFSFCMPKGKKPDRSNAKWCLSYTTTRCDHLLPENWTTTPWKEHPVYIGSDRVGIYAGARFDDYWDAPTMIEKFIAHWTVMPSNIRIVTTGAQILEARAAGLIPVVRSNNWIAPAVQGFVHCNGGVCYLMRECIHCAVARVMQLKRAMDFVVIIAGRAVEYREPFTQTFI